MPKHKIIMLSDHQLCHSGVGLQAFFLIQGLIQTGKYSFKCFGGAMKHQNYDTVVVSPDFIIKPVDGFGTKEDLKRVLITEQPDAVLIFTDPRQFIWLWEMEDEIHQICPIAYWHVWDNDPYPTCNTPWYESTDLINCISWKTYELVKSKFPEKTNYIPHTFPKEVFHPLPQETIINFKKEQLKEKADWFIGLWVGRNAHRKCPNDILESWKIFLKNLEKEFGHRKAMLIMHTDPTDIEGPNLFATSEMLELQNNVMFSIQKYDNSQMNLLYNISDFCINISRAEGFGESILISRQVGKPIIALKTGGMTRQVVDSRNGTEQGIALEPAVRALIGSQQVPYIYDDYPDKNQVAEAYMKLYKQTPQEKEALRGKLLDYIDYEYSFPKMISDWDSSFEKCISEFKAKTKFWSLNPLRNPIGG